MCIRREEEKHTNMTEQEWGVCITCGNIFELTTDVLIYDGVTKNWLCLKCNSVSNDNEIEKIKEFELQIE